MYLYSTVSPIAQQLVQVHAIVEKIAGVNGPLKMVVCLPPGCARFAEILSELTKTWEFRRHRM